MTWFGWVLLAWQALFFLVMVFAASQRPRITFGSAAVVTIQFLTLVGIVYVGTGTL